MSELPSEEERQRAVDSYRRWRRANGIGCVSWMLLAVMVDAVLRNWLPESMETLLLAVALTVPAAWFVRKAFLERGQRAEPRDGSDKP